jgi:hypothetical protein
MRLKQMIDPFFICKFCNKKFINEKRYIAHNCEEKKRSEFSATKTGKLALNYYNTWLNLRGRRSVNIETFTTCYYYKSFTKFVTFTKEMGIPNVKKFIELMVERDMPPNLWSHSAVYQNFIEWFDKNTHPLEFAKITANTILDLSKIFDCESREVFSYMLPLELINLIHSRKLSPWILLLSKAFQSYLSKLPKHQFISIESVIDPERWMDKFSKNSELISDMKKIVRELNI